jgi:FkbM family methyltransferase
VSGVLRAALETLTHRFVLRRRMPPPFSARHIYVSSEGGLRYLGRMDRVDPYLINAAADHVATGMQVWDIGANVGLFSVAAATRADRVIAVEPDAWLVRLLRRSAAANDRIEVVEAAVAAEAGSRELIIAKRSRSTNHLAGYGSTQTGGTRRAATVRTTTLDELAERYGMPDLVKIDVEGAEAEVLAGGPKVLAARPTIIIEVADESADAVGALLAGYDLTDLETGEPTVRPAYNTLARRGGR